MDDRNAQAILADMDATLEQERSALIAGDLVEITQLYNRKESLIEELHSADPAPQSELSELQGKLVRNQMLLNSALEGIRNVANRLGSLRRARKTLETYDRNGHKSAISTPSEPNVERRA